MNYIFEHIRNSEGSARDALIDSCIKQVLMFDSEDNYSVLKSITPKEREKYIMETLKTIHYNDTNRLRRLFYVGRELVNGENVWKLVVDIPYPEIDLDNIIENANQRGRVELARSLRHTC